MPTTKELLETAEAFLQAGDIKSAAALLGDLKTADLNGPTGTLYVRLSWRAGQAEQGLRYLAPLLKNKAFRATTADWAEYAMCLNAVGASAEAQATLVEKCQKDSYFNLYRAFSHIYEWDYAAAIPLLEKAIQQTDLPPYQLNVARVNLLSSYIAEDFIPQAEPLYEKLVNDLLPSYVRLRNNLKELRLQMLVLQGRFDEGLAILNQEFKTPPTSGPEVFYYNKWKTILKVEMGLEKIETLIELRNEALISGRWEIARDCEARVAFKTANPVFLKRVYYATPWPAYRKRILAKFGTALDVSSPFEFWMTPSSRLHEPTPSLKFIVDVESGDLGESKLKPGSLAHRLLRTLCSDLFRPHPIGALFFKLFENEKFDLASSPTRIYRAINELREIIANAKAPIDIKQDSQGYQLVCHESLSLILPPDVGSNKVLIRLQPLRSFGSGEFSAKEVADVLGVSLKTAQRVLKEALAAGTLVKTGDGSGTRYKWSLSK